MTFMRNVEAAHCPHCCRLIASHLSRCFQSTHCHLKHPFQTSPCVPQGRQQLEAKFYLKCQPIQHHRSSLLNEVEPINSFPCGGECFWRLLRISPIVQAWAKSTEIRNENLFEPRLRKQKAIASDDFGQRFWNKSLSHANLSQFSLYSQFFLGQINDFGGTVEIWWEFPLDFKGRGLGTGCVKLNPLWPRQGVY